MTEVIKLTTEWHETFNSMDVPDDASIVELYDVVRERITEIVELAGVLDKDISLEVTLDTLDQESQRCLLADVLVNLNQARLHLSDHMGN